MIRAFAPASIGNFAAGFDILGAAILPEEGPLGDVVEVLEGDGFEATGPWAHRLPSPEENLVVRTRELVLARGVRLPPHRLRLHKLLPVCSGLGSSAASIVATLVALDALSEGAIGADVLAIARELEPHLDNVASSLRGGLCAVGGGIVALPFPAELRACVVHPELELATAEARAVLPTTLPRGDAVAFARNLALFVHALHAGDRGLLARTLHDPLAEPHRAGLVRGFAAVKAAALGAGALGCSLSGSGPSVFAVSHVRDAHAVADAMVAAFTEAGITSRRWVCTLDPGARLL